MTIEALLRALVESLRTEGIPFMLTGSVAGAFYGAGRATMDVDVVIDPDTSRLQAFVDALSRPARTRPPTQRELRACPK